MVWEKQQEDYVFPDWKYQLWMIHPMTKRGSMKMSEVPDVD